jgi:hypothetical protein
MPWWLGGGGVKTTENKIHWHRLTKSFKTERRLGCYYSFIPSPLLTVPSSYAFFILFCLALPSFIVVYPCTVKRLAVFPSSAGMSLTKLSLNGNNLFIPVQGEFG